MTAAETLFIERKVTIETVKTRIINLIEILIYDPLPLAHLLAEKRQKSPGTDHDEDDGTIRP